ncbi:hypothetical protein AAG570_006656 [Ranatra chinensis]|uniref:EF-hand domain-containing protein n=1 Tax=Ranatra chinensis TaxID=642074 RepID=A0ABD0ZBN1_9HEMI
MASKRRNMLNENKKQETSEIALEREGGPELNFNPLDVNKLSPEDERRLYQLLGKIALQVTAKSILLKPFYQDYLLQGKKGGLVTRGMLDQVLKFLDINLSAEDFHILVKRYMHDALTVRYMAFMKEIDGVIKYYDDHQMVDLAGKLLPSFKDIELDEAVKSYLRPEIVEAPRAPEVGLQKIFREDWRGKTPPEELIMIIKKIQAHVQKEKIRAEDFFRVYDTNDCGRIPVAAFLRGLSELRETWRRERTVLYLSKLELKSLCDLYRDPGDLERILWQQFCRDVEEVLIRMSAALVDIKLERISFMNNVENKVISILVMKIVGIETVLGEYSKPGQK